MAGTPNSSTSKDFCHSLAVGFYRLLSSYNEHFLLHHHITFLQSLVARCSKPIVKHTSLFNCCKPATHTHSYRLLPKLCRSPATHHKLFFSIRHILNLYFYFWTTCTARSLATCRPLAAVSRTVSDTVPLTEHASLICLLSSKISGASRRQERRPPTVLAPFQTTATRTPAVTATQMTALPSTTNCRRTNPPPPSAPCSEELRNPRRFARSPAPISTAGTVRELHPVLWAGQLP